MKAWIGIAMLVALTVCGATASAQEPADSMTRIERSLRTPAKKSAEKVIPDLWGQIDKAMDDFIKPVGGKSPDPAKVQTGYDTFIAKLQLAVKSDAAPKR